MQPIKIRTLGTFSVGVADSTANIPRHAQALIAHLAASRWSKRERQEVADILWEGAEMRRKRHSLSQLLYDLEHIVPGLLWKTREHVGLSAAVWVDLNALREHQRQGDAASARDLYQGAFLEGFPFISEAFDEWRTATAADIENEVIKLSQEVLSHLLENEDFPAAAEAAKNALLLCPYDESIAVARVESLAAMGEVAHALRELDYLKRKIAAATGTLPQGLSDSLRQRLTTMPRVGHTADSGAGTIPVVGRAAELRQLREHWERSKTSLRVAHIRGEPGIGKTRIMEQLLRRAALEGARVYCYDCFEADTRLPHSGVAGLIRDGFRSSDKDKISETWLETLAGITPELFCRPMLSAHLQQRIICEAVTQYFASVAAETPVVIAVDNIQWLDEASRDIIAYLTKRQHDLGLLLIACSTASLRSSLDVAIGVPCLELELAELPADKVLEFMDRYESSRGVSIDKATRQLLLTHVGGRPFLLLQALSAVVDGGRNAGTGDLLPSVASGVAEYILTRLNALPHTARDIAAVLACVGRAVPIHQLARITDVSIGTVSHSIRTLVDAGLIADEPVTRFTHDLHRQAVLHELREPLRAAWHARIADVLKQLPSTSNGEIAYHLERAGDPVVAFDFALKAADEAAAIGSYNEAELQFERCIRCSPSSNRMAAWSDYAHFLLRIGRLERLEEVVDELDQFYSLRSDMSGQILCKLVRFSAAERRCIEANALLTDAKEILSFAEQHTPTDLTMVLWQVGDCIRRSGERDVLSRFAKLLAEKGKVQSGAAAIELLTAAALLGGVSIGYEFSRPLAVEAELRSRQSSDVLLRARALFALGTADLGAGRLVDALEHYQTSLKLATDAHIDGLETIIKSNLALLFMEQMQYQLSEEIGIEAAREERPTRRAYATGNLALVQLRKGDFNQARHYAELLSQLNTVSVQPWIPDHVHALLGLSALGERNIELARACAKNIHSDSYRLNGLVDVTPIVILLSQLQVYDGHYLAAMDALREAADRMKPLDWIAHSRLVIEQERIALTKGVRAARLDRLQRIRADAVQKGVSALVAEIDQLLI